MATKVFTVRFTCLRQARHAVSSILPPVETITSPLSFTVERYGTTVRSENGNLREDWRPLSRDRRIERPMTDDPRVFGMSCAAGSSGRPCRDDLEKRHVLFTTSRTGGAILLHQSRIREAVFSCRPLREQKKDPRTKNHGLSMAEAVHRGFAEPSFCSVAAQGYKRFRPCDACCGTTRETESKFIHYHTDFPHRSER